DAKNAKEDCYCMPSLATWRPWRFTFSNSEWGVLMTRLVLVIGILSIVVAAPLVAAEQEKFVRFQKGDDVAYGKLEGDTIRRLDGDLFGKWTVSDVTHKLADVKLLPPTKPSQVLALAGNYRSHLGNAPLPPTAKIPQPFFKSPSCLIGQEGEIVIPRDATDVHYEAELVIVIG